MSSFLRSYTDSISAEASIIVPVCNEAFALAQSAPLLLAGLPDSVEVLYVCNGCTDGSATLLRSYRDHRVQVIELEAAGKAAALSEGERHATIFPRFYVDADVHISGSDLMLLANRLGEEDVELVSPALSFDETGCSFLARAANRIWLRLPYARTSAFQQVIGISKAGRARWGAFPDITADDSYIYSQVPTERCELVRTVIAKVRPPANLPSLIGVRMRILKGLDELKGFGVHPKRTAGQNAELFRLLTRTDTALGAAVYIAIGLVARIMFLMGAGRHGWYRDESSRRPAMKAKQ